MDRVDDATGYLRPRWGRIAWAFGVLLLAAVLAWGWWRAGFVVSYDGIPANAGSRQPAFEFAVLALMCLLAMAFVIGVWGVLRLQQLAAELREARLRQACVDDLLDVWQWHTDSKHWLIRWRPPRSAAPAEWRHVPIASRLALWEQFTAADAAGFRVRLEQGAPLDDIDGQRSGFDGKPQACRLSGRARSDALGLFTGYIGTLRDLPVAATSGSTHVATPVATSMALPAPAPGTAESPLQADTSRVDSASESFNYTVSHDLRAPIRVVEGFTKIIKEDYGRLLDRVGNDHLDRVLGAAMRMNSMIDALLALSTLSSQPLIRQPVDLSQLAGYVSDDLRRQCPERNVTVEIEPGLHVLGDPTLLRMLLENLLSNAWKYTGKRAEGRIWFERRPQEPDTFSVRDNGAGFDMRFADRLFGVFQRLHSAHEFTGTGIGLASVRRIVHRHGGEIRGEANVNRGASFHFSLPQQRSADAAV